MRPPAPSTSPATSPTPRRAVPLKSMCSWKWASPASCPRSSAEPARTQTWSSATGAACDSQSRSPRPFGRTSRRIGSWLGVTRRTYHRGVPDATVGVYVHVPYCERVCPYCDFAVVAARPLAAGREARFARAILAELAARAGAFAGRRLASLYFGGGTPSLLRPETLARLAAAVQTAFAPPPGPGAAAETAVEVTLEVNPSTLERERLPEFRAAGITRLSVGVQSFDDAVLKRLGRAHRAREGRRTLEAARAAGFANLSLDLIFALPGPGTAAPRAHLAPARALAPP